MFFVQSEVLGATFADNWLSGFLEYSVVVNIFKIVYQSVYSLHCT